MPAGNATYSGTISATTQLAGGHFSTAGYVGNALTIAGNNTITNTGATPITNRNGTVIISGSQNYTGGTSMNGAAFVQFGKTTSMPSTTRPKAAKPRASARAVAAESAEASKRFYPQCIPDAAQGANETACGK